MNFTNLFRFDEQQTSTRTLLILIALAWIFGIAMRMIWVYQHQEFAQYKWADQLMINTNDGYYWAEGARDLLENPATINELSPVTRSLPIITAVIAKILPFVQFETLILYLPAIFGSLLVVPIILIAHSIGHTKMGFVASLIAVIAHSYYNRTMTGYYDDDMLVIVLPMMVLWSLIYGVYRHENRYLAYVLLTTLISHWYYPGSYSLHIAMSFMLLLYTLIFHRNDTYNYKLFAISLIAIAYTAFSIKLLAGFLLLFIFIKFKNLSNKIIYILAILSFIFVLFLGGFSPIISQLNDYVFRASIATTTSDLHFYNVVQTVREAGAISFDTFASRISGHTITFLLAFIGTVFLMISHRAFLLALPFVGLGFLAYGIPGIVAPAGLRFTIYAVPVLALGFGYLAFLIAHKITQNRVVVLAIATVLTAGAIIPNILHINDYRVPTVFNSLEVEALDKLKNMVNPRTDYAISWWDYGYPIRYYSYAKTLVDGGKHAGEDNFAASFALTIPNQLAGANLARSVVEATEKNRDYTSPIIAQVMKEQNITNTTEFILSLTKPTYKQATKTRDIYFVLPYKMGDIFPTVMLFSNLDLSTGEQFPQPHFWSTSVASSNAQTVVFRNGMQLNQQNGTLQIGAQIVPIKQFITTAIKPDGSSMIQSNIAHQNGRLNIIYFSHLGSFWILDDRVLNSNFVQLFALENYDRSVFEPVVMSPLIKIYKLRI